MGERLKLGKINFLNVLPVYHPLESGVVPHPFTIVSGTPAHLNGLMAEGRLDLSAVSSIEYARHPERYLILPDISVACCGAVKSVLLLSRVPMEALAGQSIIASVQSHTSVALLKILLALRFNIEATLTPGNCTEAMKDGVGPAALLAIGDEALRFKNHPHYPYRWDLGEEWIAWTGLPFVFALWVVQSEVVERWNGRLKEAARALVEARNWGYAHLDHICNLGVQQGLLGFEELHEYYRCLHFNLTESERRGLELFYSYLPAIGDIQEAPSLDIYSPLARVA